MPVVHLVSWHGTRCPTPAYEPAHALLSDGAKDILPTLARAAATMLHICVAFMLNLNIPIALFGLIVVGAFMFLGVGGLLVFQKIVARHVPFSEETNNDVIFFASAIGVFYSLVMGLIAVEVWSQYDQTNDIVSEEAASIAALYRDVSGLPEPLRAQLLGDIRDYLTFVIEQDWPAQAQGQILDGGTKLLDTFQAALYAYEPKTLGQQSIYGETLSQYNQMINLRRRRIDAVGSTLPGVMWVIVVVGAFLAITVTYLLKIERPTHILLTAFLALFVGLVVFVIYSLDNPMGGPLAIEASHYQIVLDRLVNLR